MSDDVAAGSTLAERCQGMPRGPAIVAPCTGPRSDTESLTFLGGSL